MRRIIVFCFALILFASPIGSFAQQDSKPAESPTHYYRLSYSIQEVGENGKVINNRAYTTSIATGGGPFVQIRTGDKIPIKTDDKGNVSYVDVGVNIDCSNAREVNGKLGLQINAEISSTVKATDPSASPILRQNRWGANVLVPIAKPTIVFSSDNLQDKGRLQVELTATRID